MSPFRQGQAVFHETFGPGRVHRADALGVEVEFHDGRHEAFKSSYANETLRASTEQGFATLYLANRSAVLQTLETNPNEVLRWLAADIGRELTVRTAKPLLKRLRLFPDDVLTAAWARGTRNAQSQPPKRRIADEATKVVDEFKAKDLEVSLWNPDIHIQSRNTIFKTLCEFHETGANEDFFFRALFFPVPVARAHAYGLFKKRGRLRMVWDYLIRKPIDEKSALGILDIWFRLAADSSSEDVREFGQRAAEIFVELQKTRSARDERRENLRRLFTTQTGSVFTIAKICVFQLPREWWDDLLVYLSIDDKRLVFQVYFQAAVSRSDETEAIAGLSRLLHAFQPEEFPDLAISVATFTKAAGRYAFLRSFLRRAAELVAAQPDIHDSGLERLRNWLISNRDVLDLDLEQLFVTLGHPIEERPLRLDRAGHFRRLQDPSVPLAARQSSADEVAVDLQRAEIATLIGRLASEAGSASERLVQNLWARWLPRHDRRDAAAALFEVLRSEDLPQAVRHWVFTRAEEARLSDDIAELLSKRILGRRLGEPTDPAIRSSLAGLDGSQLGRALRSRLLSSIFFDEEARRANAFQVAREPLAALGIAPEVFDFFARVLLADVERIDELASSVAKLELKFQDILASDEVKSEIRRMVDESLGAREGQLREESERGVDVLASSLAEFYVDLTTFVNGLKSKTDNDTVAVGSILGRRVAELLSSRLGRAVIGEPGTVVTFDPSRHEPMGDSPRWDEKVLVIRPGIEKTGSREVVSKAIVKRR